MIELSEGLIHCQCPKLMESAMSLHSLLYRCCLLQIPHHKFDTVFSSESAYFLACSFTSLHPKPHSVDELDMQDIHSHSSPLGHSSPLVHTSTPPGCKHQTTAGDNSIRAPEQGLVCRADGSLLSLYNRWEFDVVQQQ